MNRKIIILSILMLFIIPLADATQSLTDKYSDSTANSQAIGHPTADWKACSFWRPENTTNSDQITNIGLYIKKNNAGARGTKMWIEIFAPSTGTDIAAPSGTSLMKSLSNITIGSLSTTYAWLNWTMPNTTLGGVRTNYTICLYSNMTTSAVTTWGVFETSTYPEPSQIVNQASGAWAETYPSNIFSFKVYKDTTGTFKIHAFNFYTGLSIPDFNVEIHGTENISSLTGTAISSLLYNHSILKNINVTATYYYAGEYNNTNISSDLSPYLTPFPYISLVSTTTPDGTYIKDDEINFTVQFTANVDVTGSPVLEIETGTIDRNATYIDGTGTTELIFNYTIQSGDYSSDLTYKATDSLQLNSGTIKDTYGNNLLLTLPSPSVFQAGYDIKILVGISNCTDLQNMNNALSANYFLMNDINCTDSMSWIDYPYAGCVGFCGIGTTGGGATPFSGIFDGQGHTISNIYIANSLHNNAGLFNYISNAIIKNVNIINLTVSNSAGGVVAVGSLVGYAKTTTGQENHIDNVNMTTTMMTTANIDSMGGMIGYAYTGGTGGGASCPLLYTWNGNNYEFISDMAAAGKIGFLPMIQIGRKPNPQDYTKIETEQLIAKDGKYNMQISEQYDEIAYLDEQKLITVDHPNNTEVFTSILNSEIGRIYTVSKSPNHPLSCRYDDGKDCLSNVLKIDDHYVPMQIDEPNTFTIDFGSISTSGDLNLIITYSLVSGTVDFPYRRIQVKNVNGEWTDLYLRGQIRPAGFLQTFVANLTGKLNYSSSVRFMFPSSVVDYIAIDTLPQAETTVNIYSPTYADLHYRGYSKSEGDIVPELTYSILDNKTKYSDPNGYFTRYGDVKELLSKTDDIYVIMRHGDEVSVSYDYKKIPSNMERDFFVYTWNFYKRFNYLNGSTVNPLPFTGMTKYPYNNSESYPYDAEHIAYLNEYNTRYYNGSNSGHNTNYISNVNINITIEGDGSSVNYVGGLIGENDDDAYIDNVTVNMYLNGSNDINSLGGLIGYNPTYPVYIYNSTTSILSNGTDALAASYFGGVIGYTEGNIQCFYCYSSINISGENKYTYIGGVIGSVYNGADISLTNNKVHIYTNPDSATSELYSIGGFINYIFSSLSDITIEDSYVFGLSNITNVDNVANLIATNADPAPITISNVYSSLNITNSSGDYLGQTCLVNSGINASYVYSGVYILNNSCYDDGSQTFYGTEFLTSREMTFTSTFEGYDFINTWCRGSVSPGLRFWDRCTDATITVNLYNAWSGTLIKTVSDINVSIDLPYELQQDVTATGTGLFYVSAGKYEVNVSNPMYQSPSPKNGTINASNNIVLNFVLVPKYQVRVIRETTGKPFDFNELMSTQTCFANESYRSKTFTPQLTPDRVSYSVTACDLAGPCDKAFDTLHETYAMPNLSSSVVLKFNYSKEASSNSSSYLAVKKDFYDWVNLNMSSFPTCYALSTLQFKYMLNDSENNMTLSCYNGATWVKMLTSLSGAKAYDQIMYWNNITTTRNTTTCENKQTMTMKVETWCPKDLGFNTKDQLVVNILTNESTDISYNSTNKINCTYKYWIVTALYSDANYQRPLIPDTTDFNPYLYMIDLNPEKDLAIVIDYIIQDPTLAFKNGKIRVMTIVNNTNVIVIESLLNSEKRQQLVLVKNRVYQVYIIDADGNAFYVPGDLIADSSKTLYVSVPDIYLIRTEIDAGLQTKDVTGDQAKGTVRFRYTSTFDEPPVYVNFTIYEDGVKVISNITHSKKSYYLDVINLDPSKDVTYRLIIVPRSRYALSVDTTDTLWYGGEGIFKGWGTTINDTSSGTTRLINKNTMVVKFLVAMMVVILVLLSFTQISAVVGMVATLTISSVFLIMGWFEYMYNPLVNAHTLPGGVLTLAGLFGLFALFTVFMFFRGNSE
jgi:hypothetical protein